ncbi:MAG: hypothetical protein KC503_09150, partial [Myxococcales bacterium]|nr:hypothetical protein [Myxococcales bacterium]
TPDTGTLDTLAPDATVDTLAPDATVDTLAPDATVDTLAPDSTVDTLAPDSTVDTLAPDTSVDASADQGIVSCKAKYGAANGFSLCAETGTTCKFYVRTNGATCGTLCAAFGGSCFGGRDNAGTCGEFGTDSCNIGRQSQVCRCSR